jgi:hypothetical protein
MPIDWYDQRHTLRSDQEFITHTGDRVKLDRPVPGDGTAWYVADWINGEYLYYDSTIEPSDLKRLINQE